MACVMNLLYFASTVFGPPRLWQLPDPPYCLLPHFHPDRLTFIFSGGGGPIAVPWSLPHRQDSHLQPASMGGLRGAARGGGAMSVS